MVLKVRPKKKKKVHIWDSAIKNLFTTMGGGVGKKGSCFTLQTSPDPAPQRLMLTKSNKRHLCFTS